MVFTVTYRGRHTCKQSPRRMNPQFSTPGQNQEPAQQVSEPPPEQNMHQQQQTSQEILQSFVGGLRVITEELDSQNQPPFPPPFNFTPPGYFSTPFASPSGTSNFQGNVNQIDIQSAGSDHLAEIVSAATSGTNATGAGSAFDQGNTGFNQNTQFGGPGFFN